LLQNDVLKYRLDKYQQSTKILYAFVIGEKVFYIGKSIKTLHQRMYGYQNPGSSQRTNIANHQRLIKLLETGQLVQIFVLAEYEPITYRGVLVNLAAGLEDELIQLLKPPWNGSAVFDEG
jgi:hypothetical protein